MASKTKGKSAVAAAAPAAAAAAAPATDNVADKRPSPPDDKKHKAALAENQAAKDELQKQFDEIKDKLKQPNIADTYEPKINELEQKMKNLDIQRKGARDQNSTLKNQVKESNSTHAAKAKDLDAIKKKLQFQTIKEFDAAISAHETKLKSGTLTMLGEKQTVNEISSLQKGKKQLEEILEKLPAAQPTAAESAQLDAKRAALESAQNDLDAKDKLFDIYRADLKKLTDQKNADQKERKSLLDKRDKIKSQLDDLDKKKKAIDAALRKENEAWFKYQAKEAEKKREAQRKLREEIALEKKKAAEAKRREERSIPKFDREIAICNSLIIYLQKYVNDSTSEEGNIAKSASAEEAFKKAEQEEGVKVLKKKSERVDDLFFYKGKGNSQEGGKGKSPAASTPAAPKNIKFPLGTMDDFWTVKQEVPSSLADIPQAIEKLKAARDSWTARQKQELLKAMQEEMEEEAGAQRSVAATEEEEEEETNVGQEEEEEEAETNVEEDAAATANGDDNAPAADAAGELEEGEIAE